jgi:hypothetical protein
VPSAHQPPPTVCPANVEKDRHSMSKQTESNLFMLSPVAVKHDRLYQQLLTGIASFEQLGNRVLREIKTAHAFRQVEAVRELARILINIPIKEYRLIAQYYLVWCQCRELKDHSRILERIVEESRTYKAKALLSRAAFEVYHGTPENALYFYTESLQTKPTVSDYIVASRSIATVKAMEGFHQSALKDLEKLIPVIQHAEPRTYYDFLNSYAVELAEAGRLQEAENVTGMVIQSPLAFYYPEWQETRSGINRKLYKSSSVAVSTPTKARKKKQPKKKSKPAIAKKDEESNAADSNQQPARVLSFPHIELERIGGVLVPQREEIDMMIRVANEGGAPALLAILLKMVLKDRITRSEIQLICDVFYHD